MVDKEINELSEGSTINANDKIVVDQYDASTNPTGETVFKRVGDLFNGVDFLSGLIESPSDKTYVLVRNVPYAGTINTTTTKSTSGTCTATFKINDTALGGTANSVSSTEDPQNHSSSNSFSAGDDIKVTISSNSSCADMAFTVKFTRALA